MRFSGLFSALLVIIVLSPSLQSFPPAEAIRSSHLDSPSASDVDPNVCNPSLVHVAITLDSEYLRGSIAAVHSILHHSSCPESVFFHLIVSESDIESLVRSTFPESRFKFYHFDPEIVRTLISSSVRQALEQPLNYARNYLPDLLEPCVRRVIYLDSDLILVDDIAKLWRTRLGSRTIGAPEYCHAKWMEIQKRDRIYELGSLPPLLLVFAGEVAPIEHRWNQHGLGGDNVRGSCRDLHPGPVSLLHWSGSGKPWFRLDSGRPCPLDSLWAPYDLYGHSH
ncbi:hypothetical protein Bca4012_039874 [Brassica carinata]